MKKVFFILIVASISLTSCKQWYLLQNFFGIGHYEIVSNAENFYDNNRYDSINKKWIGPDSVRLNFLEEEAKNIEMNNKEHKKKQNKWNRTSK